MNIPFLSEKLYAYCEKEVFIATKKVIFYGISVTEKLLLMLMVIEYNVSASKSFISLLRS